MEKPEHPATGLLCVIYITLGILAYESWVRPDNFAAGMKAQFGFAADIVWFRAWLEITAIVTIVIVTIFAVTWKIKLLSAQEEKEKLHQALQDLNTQAKEYRFGDEDYAYPASMNVAYVLLELGCIKNSLLKVPDLPRERVALDVHTVVTRLLTYEQGAPHGTTTENSVPTL